MANNNGAAARNGTGTSGPRRKGTATVREEWAIRWSNGVVTPPYDHRDQAERRLLHEAGRSYGGAAHATVVCRTVTTTDWGVPAGQHTKSAQHVDSDNVEIRDLPIHDQVEIFLLAMGWRRGSGRYQTPDTGQIRWRSRSGHKHILVPHNPDRPDYRGNLKNALGGIDRRDWALYWDQPVSDEIRVRAVSSVSPVPKSPVRGEQAVGTRVQMRHFPSITGTVISCCAPSIRVRWDHDSRVRELAVNLVESARP